MEMLKNENDIKRIEDLLKLFLDKINKNPDTEEYTNEKLVTFISELSDLENRRDEFPKKIEDKDSEISEKQRELEGFNAGAISFDKLNRSTFNDISLKSFLTSNGELDNISNIFERIQEGKDTVLEKLSGSLKSLEEELKNIKEDEKNLVDKISEIKKAINMLKNQIRLAENLFKKVEDGSIINESPGKVIEVLKNIDFSDEEAKLIANLLQYNQELVIQYRQDGVLNKEEEKASIGSVVSDALRSEEPSIEPIQTSDIDFSVDTISAEKLGNASMKDIEEEIYGNEIPTFKFAKDKEETAYQTKYVPPLYDNIPNDNYLIDALTDSGLIKLGTYENFIKENCDVDFIIKNLNIFKKHSIDVKKYLGTKIILYPENMNEEIGTFFIELGEDKDLDAKIELLKSLGYTEEELSTVIKGILESTVESINERYINDPTNRSLSYLLEKPEILLEIPETSSFTFANRGA